MPFGHFLVDMSVVQDFINLLHILLLINGFLDTWKEIVKRKRKNQNNCGKNVGEKWVTYVDDKLQSQAY